MVGSAVGLGNIWRFPYLAGENGGAAFTLIYLAFSLLLCLPVFCAEFVIGRRGRGDTVGSLRTLAPGTRWHLGGYVSLLAVFLIISFYIVVGGWSLKYLAESLVFSFSRGADTDYAAHFHSFSTAAAVPLACMLLFLAITAAVVLGGVQKGIERYSKWMMPIIFVIVLFLAVRSLFLPGGEAGFRYLFKPDFSRITPDIVMAALGQSFLSLSLGMGVVITYGSYVKKSDNILGHASLTVVLDILFALLAACAIMPTVFSQGIQPDQGPGLVFVTLPYIFSNMPFGGAVAILFFLSLLLAAVTSAISLLEVLTSFVMDKWHIPRRRAVLANVLLISVTGTLCCLSLGSLSGFKIAGRTLFDLFDYVSSDILLTLSALVVVLFVGWRMKREDFFDEINGEAHGMLTRRLVPVVYYLVKYAAPVTILLILFSKIRF